jgi:hypothetical protein
VRLGPLERELLGHAASHSLDGTLRDWPKLRALFRRLGAPHGKYLHARTLRRIAGELLVEVGLRPRPGGPLVAITFEEHVRRYLAPPQGPA